MANIISMTDTGEDASYLLSQFADWAKIDLSLVPVSEHSLIINLIGTAIKKFEAVSGQIIGKKTIVEGFKTMAEGVKLRWTPVQAITKVEYYTGSETWTTELSSVYRLESMVGGKASIYLQDDQSFSSPSKVRNDSWKVTYTAGYNSLSEIPENLRLAMLAFAIRLYYKREDSAKEKRFFSSALAAHSRRSRL